MRWLLKIESDDAASAIKPELQRHLFANLMDRVERLESMSVDVTRLTNALAALEAESQAARAQEEAARTALASSQAATDAGTQAAVDDAATRLEKLVTLFSVSGPVPAAPVAAAPAAVAPAAPAPAAAPAPSADPNAPSGPQLTPQAG